jgi:DNA end-binding protein Ku
MAARPSWQGHLKLSLVTCPVMLINAISPRGDVHFHLINPETGNRIRVATVDSGTGEPVERKDLVKGFEIAKGAYVTLTPEEIDGVRLESTKTIDIDHFVPEGQIDRLYWDNPYFLVPDGKLAAEPFAVIRAAPAPVAARGRHHRDDAALARGGPRYQAGVFGDRKD